MSMSSFWSKVTHDFKQNLLPNVRHGIEAGAVGGAVQMGRAGAAAGPEGIVAGGVVGLTLGAVGGAVFGVIHTGWQAVEDASLQK